MQPVTRQALVASSLLDRLMDDQPGTLTEAQAETLYDVSALQAGGGQGPGGPPEHTLHVPGGRQLVPCPLTRNSLLLFGIPDLSSLSLLNPEDRMFLRDSIRRTIERYEPRLTKVRVNLEISRELNQMLRFRVDALLKVHPSRPPVTFDAMLQLSSNTYHVKD